MSTEVVAIVISAIGIVLTLGASTFAGAAWVIRRIDERIDGLDHKLSNRIDAVDEKLSARIDAVASDVNELKISVARLEGPPRHLLTASR